MKNYKIAVAGTGYVGLSIATLLSQHHKVTAVDIVPEKVEMINNRKSPIQDDYIEKYLAEKDLNLTATLDAKAAYSDADFVVIAAPTNYDSQTQHFDTSAVTPNATNGEKIKALRTAQGMSMAELSRRASMSDRAIRYIEAGEREPSVDAIQKIAAALGVTTDYFMDDATFQKELSDDQFYADVRKKYPLAALKCTQFYFRIGMQLLGNILLLASLDVQLAFKNMCRAKRTHSRLVAFDCCQVICFSFF